MATRTQRQGIRPSAGLPESGERAGALRQERERERESSGLCLPCWFTQFPHVMNVG